MKLNSNDIWAKAKLANSIAKELERLLLTHPSNPQAYKCLQDCYRVASSLAGCLQDLEGIVKNQK